MMHLSRRHVVGGLTAALTTAGVLVLAVAPTPGAASLPAWSHTLLAAALALTALALALLLTAGSVRVILPQARRGVRTLRARRIRRRARTARRAPTPTTAPGSMQRRAARVIVAVVVAAVLAVVGVAVALNYAHARDVALANGETGWRALLYPIPVDGLLISSSLVMLWQLLVSGETSWKPRIAFVIGIIASIGTNTLAALHTGYNGAQLVENIVWTTGPTAILLLAHEMFLLMLAHYALAADVFGTRAPSPELDEAQQARQAAEQRAAEAEQAATLAQQQATEAIDAANADADQRVTRAQQQANEQLEELRQQVTDATRERDDHIAEQKQQMTQLQHEQQQREAELASLRAQLAEIAQADGTERTAADYAVLREWITAYVERRRTTNGANGSLTAEVVQIFGVSPRWVQQNIPDAPARRGYENEKNSLQLAGAS